MIMRGLTILFKIFNSFLRVAFSFQKYFLNLELINGIDMFKQHEILLFICYSTQKSNIGTVVGLENIFKSAFVAWLIQ